MTARFSGAGDGGLRGELLAAPGAMRLGFSAPKKCGGFHPSSPQSVPVSPTSSQEEVCDKMSQKLYNFKWLAHKVGLDEGICYYSSPILGCMENPYAKQMTEANDRHLSSTHAGRAELDQAPEHR
jgi:hypothetical protein